jgi:uncharacterized protein (TIGR03435 family)
MRKRRFWAGCFICFALSGQTAEPTSFEVAVIKASDPALPFNRNSGLRGGPGTNSPGTVAGTGVNLKSILRLAYDRRDDEVVAPSRVESARYDISAKVPPGTSKSSYHLMIQHLLISRLGLESHPEARLLPVYNLVVDRNGPKMAKAGPVADNATEGPTGVAPRIPGRGIATTKDGFPIIDPQATSTRTSILNGKATMEARHQTMTGLVKTLSLLLAQPVIDDTNLSGEYDFTLHWLTQSLMTAEPSEPTKENDAPDIFSAIKQLGLKLEKQKGNVDILVIDHLDRVPSGN